MQQQTSSVSHPSFLFTSDRKINIPCNHPRSFSPIHHRNSQLRVQKLIVCASNRRNRYGIGKPSKRMFKSACIIASKLGLVPEPLGLMLREFGAGNGGGDGFWNGFGWNGFDGWRRRRRAKLGVLGMLVICGVMGMWLVVDKELRFGGLGLILFVVSAEGWRRGAKDWVLGLCCCAFLVALVLNKEELRAWVGTTKKNLRSKRRAF